MLKIVPAVFIMVKAVLVSGHPMGTQLSLLPVR